MAADKSGKYIGPGVKPVPMKLFATWEIEKTSSNCIPRLCSLTLVRLVVHKVLEADLASIIIAVKMQSSKRVLRSNEIFIPPSKMLDTELDLSFSLQYPHHLKRDGNKLQVMLQRRKKYKNRTILGYKTLAIGQVSMAQVLQCSVDRELSMYSDIKERTNLVAEVGMLALSSQPVDHEDNGQRKHASSDVDRSPDVDNDSDEDDGPEYNEYSSNEDLSDSEPVRARPRKSSRGQIRPGTSRQRNFKQRFIALLKRFKVAEEALDSEPDHELVDTDTNPPDIDLLFDELEDLSDSGPELDTLSVISTPKPRLRPFFTGRSSIPDSMDMQKDAGRVGSSEESAKKPERTDADSHTDVTDPEISESLSRDRRKSEGGRDKLFVPTAKFSRERSRSYREKKQKSEHRYVPRRSSMGQCDMLLRDEQLLVSFNVEPRKVLLDQLCAVLGSSDDKLPESVILVNTSEWQGQLLVQKLQERQVKLICTCSNVDVKAVVNFLVTKIQKFCNSNSRSPKPIKVMIAGGDSYINSVLRPYVEQFSAKSPDWQSHIRFLVIPFGASSIGKYLASIDPVYSSLFNDSSWKDTFEKSDSQKLESQEISSRINKYLCGTVGVIQMPIAEAMVTYKGKSPNEDSAQIFLPFISEVKIGTPEVVNASVDIEEGATSPPSLSGSPPSSAGLLEKAREGHTPPSSPNVSNTSPFAGPAPSSSSSAGQLMPMSTTEYMELQVDYWTVGGRPELGEKDKVSKKDSNKNSLKTAFRSLHVCRLPLSGEVQSAAFSMVVVTKEKNKKIMRIGKKPKETESKSQVIDGINRLICTSKSQNYTLKVMVDGMEWLGVKFFQLSSQWQTHIKHFPVAIFGHSETST